MVGQIEWKIDLKKWAENFADNMDDKIWWKIV